MPLRNTRNKIIWAKRAIGSFAAMRDDLVLETSVLRVRYLRTWGASLSGLACKKHRNNWDSGSSYHLCSMFVHWGVTASNSAGDTHGYLTCPYLRQCSLRLMPAVFSFFLMETAVPWIPTETDQKGLFPYHVVETSLKGELEPFDTELKRIHWGALSYSLRTR